MAIQMSQHVVEQNPTAAAAGAEAQALREVIDQQLTIENDEIKKVIVQIALARLTAARSRRCEARGSRSALAPWRMSRRCARYWLMNRWCSGGGSLNPPTRSRRSCAA